MDALQELKENLTRLAPGLELRENEPMARHTTFRVGGPAALMALPRSGEEAIAAVRAAAQAGVAPIFVGNGSNLLVADGGVDAFLIKTVDGLGSLALEGERIVAGGGALLSRAAVFAMERGLTGLEFAHGIPGSVGGGVTMNAGAYGGELRQVVVSVTCVDRGGEVLTLPAEECAFAYRHSAFSGGERLVLSAVFALKRGDRGEIRARMDDLAARRREKQPLEYPSAGSTFKRPEGHFAAALIDRCGLKGMRVGGAQVSEKHAGFVVNRGGATCADILELMELVKQRVLEAAGVALEPEVRIIGV